MSRSIHLALIGWYALLLAAVLGVFGVAFYARTARTLLAGIDADLGGRATAMAGALEWDEDEGWELDLPDGYLDGVAADASYRIWAADGTLLRSGGEFAAALIPAAPGLRTEGGLRELEAEGPRRTRVLVARPLAEMRAQLSALRLSLVGVGVGVLVLGLGGGWWIARRTLAPLRTLAASAASIGAQDLGRRLDEEAAPVELRELARTFNAVLDRLEAAFRSQARFTADASHELRTPLAVLRSQAEQALRGERTPQDYREALTACLRASERMTGLAEGLLLLARADAGEEAAEAEPLDLDELVRDAADHLRPVADAQGLTLEVQVDPVGVRGRPRELGMLVSNLIANGLRYNRDGGRVDVACSHEDGSAVVRVVDTGIGIRPEDLPHVFERFWRADSARAAASGGAGLGLAIARRIAEAHGGTIEVASVAGAGSTFSVRLPAL